MKICIARVFTTVSVVAVIAAAPLAGQQAPPAAAPTQAARPAPLKSPEIQPPNRTVTFRLLAPKATEVTLNGSWDNGTDLKMAKDESGVWSTRSGRSPRSSGATGSSPSAPSASVACVFRDSIARRCF